MAVSTLSLLWTVAAMVSYLFMQDNHGPWFPPATWALASLCLWSAYISSRNWETIGLWDKRQFLWGCISAVAFLYFLQFDPTFQDWGDVYYFCGDDLRYCTCNFRWNALGWMKAVILWNFVLSAALGIQRLAIQVGLKGLLPGEEVVTKESFISICWRLVPYWLNNWEHQWGAECSSMMFELPHFAMELLVVLPCVQILCSRLKVLATPNVRVRDPPVDGAHAFDRANYAANIIAGYWERAPEQRKVMHRLRVNSRVMAFAVAITALAASNALLVPLALESQILQHHNTPLALDAGREAHWLNTTEPVANPWLAARVAAYATSPKACREPSRLHANTFKHRDEITKMGEAEHQALTPLVEAALAVMRLSCEKFFVLLSVFVSYLLFKDMPRGALHVVRLNARLSSAFQKVILYSFPAVCWIYGAGFIFSTFVTVVFWGGPLLAMYEALRSAMAVVRIKSLRPAVAADLERMGGNCAICWGEMVEPSAGADPARLPTSLPADGAPVPPEGYTLSCSHAYHHTCLLTWLRQCHTQGVGATCPMCQAAIEVEVKWRVPWPAGRQAQQQQQQHGQHGQQHEGVGAGPGGEAPWQVAGPVAELLPHQLELQELLRDMPAMMRQHQHEQAQQQQQEQQALLAWQQEVVGRGMGPAEEPPQQQQHWQQEQQQQQQEQQEQQHMPLAPPPPALQPESPHGEQQQQQEAVLLPAAGTEDDGQGSSSLLAAQQPPQEQQRSRPSSSSGQLAKVAGAEASHSQCHSCCSTSTADSSRPRAGSSCDREVASAAAGSTQATAAAGSTQETAAAGPQPSSSQQEGVAEEEAVGGEGAPQHRQNQFRSEVNRLMGDLEAFRARHVQLLDKGSGGQVDTTAAAAAASLASQP